MGFDTERLALRGRLAEEEELARKMELSISGDVSAIRMMLPAFAPVKELQAAQAAVQAVELASKHAEYLGLLGEIANKKKALGIV